MFKVVAVLIFFLAGFSGGWYLAKKGVTADTALQGHQKQVHSIGLLVLALTTLALIVIAEGPFSPWVPALLPVYIQAYIWVFMLLLCCFCAGFFLGLELPGFKDIKRLGQLVIFLGVSLAGIFLLIYENMPITALIGPTRILEGVILQTTAYSCAPATIATLNRIVHPTSQTTELEVVKLAGTSRQGTNTLGEIYAMKKLGLVPEYRRLLTLEDLINRKQIALLHVNELTSGGKVPHAIALLEIDSVKDTLTVGNPLSGKTSLKPDQMKDYWRGEAIFVTAKPPNG